MFRRRLPLLLLLLGFAISVIAWAQVRPSSPDAKMIKEIRSYTKWVAVNAEPVEMAPQVAMACASLPLPTPMPRPFRGSQGPHAKKWLNVFVNDVGKNAMLRQKSPKFPVGSVIVKQKFSRRLSQKHRSNLPPELLTVMIKRESGYDKPNGDWEYMVTDGKGERVTERGKIASCQGCHQPYAQTDYVVRSYLPADVMKALGNGNTSDTKPQKPSP